MDQQTQTQSMSEMVIANEPVAPFISSQYRMALSHLRWSFNETLPLAILGGGWSAGASHVIRDFLRGLDSDVVVARIRRPCSNPTAGMRQVVQSIGGGAKDMSLAELEQSFAEFVSAQKHASRRTILIVEETPSAGTWMLEKVHRLVESETQESSGLMVILSRPSHVDERLVATPLGAICDQARQPLSMSPFKLSESRAFIRWRIAADADADMSEVFDFHAITLMHHLCSGVPNALDALCCKCLWLASKIDVAPVTTDLVMKANKFLHMPHLVNRAKGTVAAENGDAEHSHEEISGVAMPTSVRLTYNGNTPYETKMDGSVLTIGRSEDNDLYINDNCVSREHAVLVRHGNKIIVMDLDSKNGTYVNSRRIHKSLVVQQDIISIGNSRVTFSQSENHEHISPEGEGIDNDVIINGLKNIRNIFARRDGAEARPPRGEKSASDSDQRLS